MAKSNKDRAVKALEKDIAGCRLCAQHFDHEPRPVVRLSKTARLCLVGQAPGVRVHESGVPFTDPSGDRLREWMGVDEDTFYDQTRIAIVPMGFCFPGLDAKGGDKPPRKECAPAWRERIFDLMPQIELTLLIGQYAQKWHLKKQAKGTLTETVAAWQDYMPDFLPMPHPSWRNNVWLKRNPWFESDILPVLKKRVAELV